MKQKSSYRCELLIRAKMVPGRVGADTQVLVHIPLGQRRSLPGGSAVEQAWLNAAAGEPGYLTDKDAETVACDALTVPVVTGHADMSIIDKIIEFAMTAHGTGHGGGGDGRADRAASRGTTSAYGPHGQELHSHSPATTRAG